MLSDYFKKTDGLGVLATADSDGNVNIAVYAKPHFIDENTIAFIMADRLSHANLATNPRAAYLFKENGPGYKGKRLYLVKTKEDTDTALIDNLRRKKPSSEVKNATGERFLVYFKIEKTIELTSAGDNRSGL
ncbi:MAG: pyridoxamine 5'-phosphate oxidase family protein [Spirochaetes bacterium]|jgi:predicted pyridoxine 5'-phosphate oxidase superfamily flavin-nucleotide-binding protein|nr:pyridoxamine 5'-phosphate oxidase family protein [Spirochaetota bacterium]